jgi:hypothetical protein
MCFLFSDVNMFDMNGVYNSQNDHVWTVDREDADRKGQVKQKTKIFLQRLYFARLFVKKLCCGFLCLRLVLSITIIISRKYLRWLEIMEIEYSATAGHYSKAVPSHLSIQPLNNGARLTCRPLSTKLYGH